LNALYDYPGTGKHLVVTPKQVLEQQDIVALDTNDDVTEFLSFAEEQVYKI
jgi:hypothetical protein